MENLAAKYRPRTLDDVTEQSVIMSMVKNICESKEITNRNFLFIGPAGCGKTTTARIIANAINEGKGEPIEVDAASHSGVDSVRALIEQMRIQPVGCKYKIFIIDECFPADTLVHTTSGLVPIKEVVPGTRVYNLTGEATVSRLFENRVKVENLVCLKINNKQLITTKNHLFFTDDGWVEAINLKEGDILYDYKTVQSLRERDASGMLQRSESLLQQRVQEAGSNGDQSTNERNTPRSYIEGVSSMYESFLESRVRGRGYLREQVCSSIQRKISSLGEMEAATVKILAVIHLSEMWKEDGDSERRSEGSLWRELCESDDRSSSTSEGVDESCDKILRELWKRISSDLFRSSQENMQRSLQESPDGMEKFDSSPRNIQGYVGTDEIEQSWSRSRNSEEDGGDQEKEWHIDPKACYAMWERTFFQATDSFETGTRGRMGVRIRCADWDKEKQQSQPLSYELQTRPCLTQIEAGSRGGWDRPQYEIATTFRRKESKTFGIARVDSIESYKRGDNDQLFQDYFSDTTLCDAEYVTMYDLAIDGHPSFFVEDILVHNCHAISSAGWQALLKTLEEQPARTVVCMATTNPEKIPATILSRVQTFQLSKISLEGIYNRLKYIIEQENKEGRNITYDDDAILYIAKLAQGGMRSGISLLDKALSFDTHITIQALEQSLGLPNYDDYFELLNAIAKKDNSKIVEIINNVYNSGVNFVKWFDGFFSFITNIVKYIYLQDIQQTMIPGIYQEKISKYGTAHAALCLKLSNKLVKMNQELKTTQYLQELAISYLCTPPAVQKG